MFSERKKARQAKAESRFLEGINQRFEAGVLELILRRGGNVITSTGTPAEVAREIREAAWQQWGDDIIELFGSLTFWELARLKNWDDVTIPHSVLTQSRADAAKLLYVPAPAFSQRVDGFLVTAQPKLEIQYAVFQLKRAKCF